MQVLSSLSGLQFSAASAGFAPTNSADVSAIASAYQVVSATATQLNAGTAYLTSVNDTPISAARAGNAANASLATSAWYDGTGRLISSLPDEATVSSIASAYAESAASGKQDTLSFSYDDDKISAINGSALAGGGGADMSSVSAIASSYANNVSAAASSTVTAVSSYSSDWAKSFTVDNVEGIDSAITGLKTAYSAPVSSLMGVGSAAKSITGSGSGSTTNVKYPMGLDVINGSIKLSASNYFWTYVKYVDIDGHVYDRNIGVATVITGVSGDISAYSTIGSFTLNYTADSVEPLAFQRDLPTYQYDAEDKISSINGSAIAGGAGGVDSATVSAIASSYAESAASSKLDTTAYNSGDFYSTSNPSGFVDSAYVDSAVSGKADSSALSSYVPYSSLEYNTASAISGINGSALAAGSTYSAGEGIDITDDVISVETPVDIVAGPGIVIDNPDGNTLRVSQATPSDETVLYESDTAVAQNSTFQLSETPANFKTIKIYIAHAQTVTNWSMVLEYPSEATRYDIVMAAADNATSLIFDRFYFSRSGTTVTVGARKRHTLSGTSVTSSDLNNPALIMKVIGIHRIANN